MAASDQHAPGPVDGHDGILTGPTCQQMAYHQHPEHGLTVWHKDPTV